MPSTRTQHWQRPSFIWRFLKLDALAEGVGSKGLKDRLNTALRRARTDRPVTWRNLCHALCGRSH